MILTGLAPKSSHSVDQFPDLADIDQKEELISALK